MTNCPRPGCAGEVVDGSCTACGVTVAGTDTAEQLRRQAEEQAQRLRRRAEEQDERDSGWFRRDEERGAGRPSDPPATPANPAARSGAHGARPSPVGAAPGSAGARVALQQPATQLQESRRRAAGTNQTTARHEQVSSTPANQTHGHLPPSHDDAWAEAEAAAVEERAVQERAVQEEREPGQPRPGRPGQAPADQGEARQGRPGHAQPHTPPGDAEGLGGQVPTGKRQTGAAEVGPPDVGQDRRGQAPPNQGAAGRPEPRRSQGPAEHGRGEQAELARGDLGTQAMAATGERGAPGQPEATRGTPATGPPARSGPVSSQRHATQFVPPPTMASRPPSPPEEAEPTGILGEAPVTLSIDPPAGPDAASRPSRPSRESPHRTGSRSAPTTGGRRTSGRGRLGAGLVEVPVVPVKDPASAVLTDPAVSENKRFCNNCGAEVGRSRDEIPGPTEGECEVCGTYFNFRPRLVRGDLVAGQYEVLGCLAYGGLGWIYLAKDHNVSERWVVLKGMIDTGDATSMASVVAERRFLAEVEHPNVVRIYNFVQHPDPKTGNQVGYIVMEYVGGQSLRQLALSHHRDTGRAEPLPIGQVIAYGLEILPAIGYLHSINMLYCDLKPDNVIQSGEQLKLIDLGAVRQTDDYESPLFFTLGYSAPELATEGASVASDIYTVGRTLAVLSIEFSGYTTRHKYTLPGPDEEPLFALFGSYHRVLKRATHADPTLRFASAEEMADQLTGVLREVMALGTGRPRPGTSTVFALETRTFGSGLVVGERGSLPSPDPMEVASILPLPMVDTQDHAASALASITATEPAELVAALASAPQDSIEVRMRMVRARLELGDLRAAQGELEAARRLVTDAADWRPDWYQGLIHLARRRPDQANASFERVYDAVPGEIPPKLALAVSAEYAGNYFAAARYYELVWRTDRAWVSAAFGLGRVYLAQGARASAIEVLEAVPDTSSHHVAAQVAAIKIKLRPPENAAAVVEHDLHDAARRLERLTLDAERRTLLAAEVLEAAYAWVRAGRPGAAPAGTAARGVLGCQLSERELRFGLERCYRTLARLAGTTEQRHALVDRANAIRPRTVT